MARPKQFDPEEALDKAIELFWSQGYEATTMQELVDAMGINRFSLYDTFGDKHSLYLAALDRYRSSVTEEFFHQIETAEDGAEAIRAFFRGQVERFTDGDSVRGCLIANCSAEMAAKDEGSAERVRRGIERSERAFRAALQKAKAARMVAPGRNLDDLARFFAASANGMSVIARAQPGREFLESSARVILSALDPP